MYSMNEVQPKIFPFISKYLQSKCCIVENTQSMLSAMWTSLEAAKNRIHCPVNLIVRLMDVSYSIVFILLLVCVFVWFIVYPPRNEIAVSTFKINAKNMEIIVPIEQRRKQFLHLIYVKRTRNKWFQTYEVVSLLLSLGRTHEPLVCQFIDCVSVQHQKCEQECSHQARQWFLSTSSAHKTTNMPTLCDSAIVCVKQWNKCNIVGVFTSSITAVCIVRYYKCSQFCR